MSEAYRLRKMREAIKLALPVLQEDRDTFIECNCLLDKKTLRPIRDTLSEDALFDLLRYDTAILACEKALRTKREAQP